MLKQFFERIICYNCQRELYMKRSSIVFCSISYYQSLKLYINDSYRYLFSQRVKRSIIVNDKKDFINAKNFCLTIELILHEFISIITMISS